MLAVAEDPAVKPLMDGPLHEAFLSPRKDQQPDHVGKGPPAPNHRASRHRPAQHSGGVDRRLLGVGLRPERLRLGDGDLAGPAAGPVLGQRLLETRRPGVVSGAGILEPRKTDRLDYRKNGPPQERPDEEPGQPPADDCFFIPGQYYPDGDGVVWKKGFWAKVQPGWSWVPSQWVRQPEGWVFQDGYWDRTLEDRGTLFAPAEVNKTAPPTDNLTYQPYATVSPELYGQLNGAFGRPNSNYDGYPGVFYDEDGRFYGYANYGNLAPYYGYLDYPASGGYGYPYYASPVQYGGFGGGGFGGGGFGGCGSVTAASAAAVRRLRGLRRLWNAGGWLRDGARIPVFWWVRQSVLRRLRVRPAVLRRFRLRRESVLRRAGLRGIRLRRGFRRVRVGGLGLGLGFGGFGFGFGSPFFGLGIPFYGGFYYPFLNAGLIGQGFGRFYPFGNRNVNINRNTTINRSVSVTRNGRTVTRSTSVLAQHERQPLGRLLAQGPGPASRRVCQPDLAPWPGERGEGRKRRGRGERTGSAGLGGLVGVPRVEDVVQRREFAFGGNGRSYRCARGGRRHGRSAGDGSGRRGHLRLSRWRRRMPAARDAAWRREPAARDAAWLREPAARAGSAAVLLWAERAWGEPAYPIPG